MLLYVTTDEGKERKARPLPRIPETLTLLYDMGQREHDRPALILQADGGGWAETPDWRFDREVIRIALYCRERLHVKPGERIAILGPLRPLWLAADFAAQGLGAAAVGLCHALGDEEVAAALNDAGARVAIAVDAAGTSRLLGLRSRVASLETVIGLDGATDDPAFHPLARLFDLGATLDTAERATAFRETARAVLPDQPAVWHSSPGEPLGMARLTHREAMARVRGHLRRLPAERGDKAYLEGEAVTVEMRFAWYAFAGDGYTTMVMGMPGKASAEVRDLRPAKVLASPRWLCELWDRVDGAPAGGIESFARGRAGLGWLRHWARDRRRREAFKREVGDRLRWVQPFGAISGELRQELSRLVSVVESTGPMPVPETEGAASAPAGPARLRPEAT